MHIILPSRTQSQSSSYWLHQPATSSDVRMSALHLTLPFPAIQRYRTLSPQFRLPEHTALLLGKCSVTLAQRKMPVSNESKGTILGNHCSQIHRKAWLLRSPLQDTGVRGGKRLLILQGKLHDYTLSRRALFSLQHHTNLNSTVNKRGVLLLRTELIGCEASHPLSSSSPSVSSDSGKNHWSLSWKKECTHCHAYASGAHRASSSLPRNPSEVPGLELEGRHAEVCALAGWNNPDTLQSEKTVGCGMGFSPFFIWRNLSFDTLKTKRLESGTCIALLVRDKKIPKTK